LRDSRPKTDAELIRAVQAGSYPAMGALYQRYLPAVWRYISTRVDADHHAVEDIVSETFLGAVGGLKELNPDGGSFYSWLMGVARHKLGDWRRRQRLRRTVPSDQAGPVDPAADADPRAVAEAAEADAAVTEALMALADEERLVLEWKYITELTVLEIAARLGKTPKAVEALLYRARKAFRTRHRKLSASD
jgi:RNA polymerase sigma-70 factor, ECF subfamily